MSHRAVTNDQDLIRSAFPDWSAIHQTMTSPKVVNVLFDIMFDWISVALAMLALHRFGWWSAPAVVAWIGNRQRALGNLLHDAAHRNLARSSFINDTLAGLYIAPALLNSLAIYRELHSRHHAWLGDPRLDPDYIAVRPDPGYSWCKPFLKVLLTPTAWLGSTFGHLHVSRLTWLQRCGIIGWWAALLGAVTLAWGVHAAERFLCVWMLSRATVFHSITTFRELCDHFGRQQGGVFSYTRDVSSHSLWRWVIHPRNNGYHLTHHLMPSIPYHRLPHAQRSLLELPPFARVARVCHAYFRGPDAVVREWEIVVGGDHGAA
ncbi:fatty acid desaturase [Paraburkholderia sp. BL25I1N1]|uniref:fatty acid desaturase family protein n=1 Tax=Paraburkholderia sp. BL25I1N1 TaxID=1938804 RepID=UPI000D08467A|nr:fatty acid desaturase [Paraburkholderia sp. BL25I1N1]PRX92088.1 fatty acid desaturase [Paraburkholderia sp. BL25I1N1]